MRPRIKVAVLGSVNAASLATMYDANGKALGTCMDTPNNMAYAMYVNPNVHHIKTPYSGTKTRAQLEERFASVKTEKDAEYHSKYVKFF